MDKRLERDTLNGMLVGVCSGMGNYTDTDPTIWRLTFIVTSFFFPPMVLVYFIFALVMPKKKR